MSDAAGPLCPVCAGRTSRASHHLCCSYWRCHACGTAHLHPQPSQQELARYYESFHLPAEQGGVFEAFENRTGADFPAKGRIVAKYLEERGQTGNQRRRALDVGCGKGLFVRECRRLGLSAEGIDVSATAIRRGAQECGTDGLRVGSLDEQVDWRGTFDAVTTWATIEHVPDPRCFLASLRRVLKPGGYLFVDTGLAGDFVERHAPGLVQWYDPPQHLFVLSRRGMVKLLQHSGFELIKLDTNFERSRARRLVKGVRNRFLAAAGACLFRTALGADAYRRMRMESKLPFGSLMFVVARLGGR